MIFFILKQLVMSKKKSVAEKEREGTLKPTRNLMDKTAPLKNWVKAPIRLNEKAKSIYTAVLGLLIKNEVATTLDTYSVALFAYWLEVFEQTTISCERFGHVQQFKSGATNITGYFSVLKESDSKVQSYMKKLGLSIKDREMITAFMENQGEGEKDAYDLMVEKIANSL